MAALVEWAPRRRRAKALRQLLNFAVGVYSRVSPNGLPLGVPAGRPLLPWVHEASPERLDPLSTLATSSSPLALRLSRRDQAKLGRSREPLDAGLLAERGESVDDRDHERELNRAPAARVAAGGAGTVGCQAPLHVGRPAAVKAVVGAAPQVDEGH